jgi:hypothetical protein
LGIADPKGRRGYYLPLRENLRRFEMKKAKEKARK